MNFDSATVPTQKLLKYKKMNKHKLNNNAAAVDIALKIKSGQCYTIEPKGKSGLWRYFRRICLTKTGENLPYMLCWNCEKVLKYDKGTSSSNLKKHMCYKKFVKNASSVVDNANNDEANNVTNVNTLDDTSNDKSNEYIDTTSNIVGDGVHVTAMLGDGGGAADTEKVLASTSKKRKLIYLNHNSRNDVLQYCMRFLYHDLRSPETIHDEGFKELARCLIEVGVELDSKNFCIDEFLPQPDVLADELQKLHLGKLEIFVYDVRRYLENGTCASTLDIWTDGRGQKRFLTFNVHYLDSNWELKNHIFFTTEYNPTDIDASGQPLRETAAEFITEAIEEKFDEFNLERNLLQKTVFTTNQQQLLANQGNPHQAPTQIHCIVDTLNTILRETFDEEALLTHAPHITELIVKCKSVIGDLKRFQRQQQSGSGSDGIKSEMLEIEVLLENNLQTKFEILCHITEHFQAIQDFIMKTEQRNCFDETENILMERLCKIINQFRDLIDLFEDNQMPTIHMVLLHMHILKEKLIKLLDEQDNVEMRAILSNCLCSIFDAHYRPDKIHKIAAFLWPAYKQMRYLNDFERDDVYALVKAELLKIANPNNDNSQHQQNTHHHQEHTYHQSTQSTQSIVKMEISEISTTTTSDEDMLSKYMDIHAENVNPVESAVDLQLEMYKKLCTSERNILNCWRRHEVEFPYLAKLARHILCIPAATGAAQPLCFGNAKKNSFADKRLSLCDGGNVDAMLFLHSQEKN